MSYNLVEDIFKDRPKFQKGEMEIRRKIDPEESCLHPGFVEDLNEQRECFVAIGPEAAKFIYDSVRAGSKTLETGAGVSTLVFAVRKCLHTAVTPSRHEIEVIKKYAASKSIPIGTFDFCGRSVRDLPSKVHPQGP